LSFLLKFTKWQHPVLPIKIISFLTYLGNIVPVAFKWIKTTKWMLLLLVLSIWLLN